MLAHEDKKDRQGEAEWGTLQSVLAREDKKDPLWEAESESWPTVPAPEEEGVEVKSVWLGAGWQPCFWLVIR